MVAEQEQEWVWLASVIEWEADGDGEWVDQNPLVDDPVGIFRTAEAARQFCIQDAAVRFGLTLGTWDADGCAYFGDDESWDTASVPIPNVPYRLVKYVVNSFPLDIGISRGADSRVFPEQNVWRNADGR